MTLPPFVRGLYDVLRSHVCVNPQSKFEIKHDSTDGYLVNVDAIDAALKCGNRVTASSTTGTRRRLSRFLASNRFAPIRRPMATIRGKSAHTRYIPSAHAEAFVCREARCGRAREKAAARIILERCKEARQNGTRKTETEKQPPLVSAPISDGQVYVKIAIQRKVCAKNDTTRFRLRSDDGRERSEVTFDLSMRDMRLLRITQAIAALQRRDDTFLARAFDRCRSDLETLHNIVAPECRIGDAQAGEGSSIDPCSLTTALPDVNSADENPEWLCEAHVLTLLCAVCTAVTRMSAVARKQKRAFSVTQQCPGYEVSSRMRRVVRGFRREHTDAWLGALTTRAWNYRHAPTRRQLEERGLLECLSAAQQREHEGYRQRISHDTGLLYAMAPQDIGADVPTCIEPRHVALMKVYWCVLHTIPPEKPEKSGPPLCLLYEMTERFVRDTSPFVIAAGLSSACPNDTKELAGAAALACARGLMAETIRRVRDLICTHPRIGLRFVTEMCGLVPPPTCWLVFGSTI